MKPSPSSPDPRANPFRDVSIAENVRLMRRGFAYRATFGLFLIIILTAAHLIPIGDPANDLPQILSAFLITLVNVPYYFVLRRFPDRVLRHQWIGPVVDLTAITVIIYFLGGMEAVYAFPFYGIVILYTAVTHRRPWHFIVAGLSSFAVAGLFLAQTRGWLPLIDNIMDLHFTPEQQGVTLVAVITFFFFTAIVSGFLSEALFQRSRDLAAANAQIEAANRELESKISERTREIEAQNVLLQRQNQRIAEANRLKTEYLININHELRTPLTSILGYGRMLLSYELDPARQREFTENILRQADTLNHFVSTLNEIEEIESGTIFLRRAPTQMGDLIDDALITMRPRSEERRLRIERNFENGSDVRVQVDPEKIRQVILNILDNALKVTPKGGEIRISTRQKGNDLEVVIDDTGPGIPPEYLEHVFERFKQINPAAAGNQGGLGIGLSLVKSIVELHGGRAWAESPGRLSREGLTESPGASFCFSIPMKIRGEAAASQDAA